MDPRNSCSCTAFADSQRIASGTPVEVALACRALLDAGDERIVVIFDDLTAQPLEFDLRGDAGDVAARLSEGETGEAPGPKRGPGRPRLGVVGKEVTLLPRHWEWLSAQPGGASVTLRKLVERARLDGEVADRVRRSQDAAFRFMSTIGGNEPGFEEACRALFAGDRAVFEAITGPWPCDVRDYARVLANEALQGEGP